jgi:hypothetical protein
MEDYDELIDMVRNILNTTEEELGWEPKRELMILKNWFYSKMNS